MPKVFLSLCFGRLTTNRSTRPWSSAFWFAPSSFRSWAFPAACSTPSWPPSSSQAARGIPWLNTSTSTGSEPWGVPFWHFWFILLSKIASILPRLQSKRQTRDRFWAWFTKDEQKIQINLFIFCHLKKHQNCRKEKLFHKIK